MLLRSVCTSLFRCSGSWNLTATQVSKLRGIQQAMLHKMIALRRRDDEPLQVFMERLNSKIKRLKIANRFEDFDRMYHRSVFKWAGHVARMRQYDSQRVTYRILQHKSWEWIYKTSQEFGGSQLHGKRFHVWRWERPVYKFFGSSSWQEAAQDNVLWNQQLDDMVSWRVCNR